MATKKQPFFARPVTAAQPTHHQPPTRRERTPSPIISNDDDDDEPPIVSPVPPNQQLFMRDESFASGKSLFQLLFFLSRVISNSHL